MATPRHRSWVASLLLLATFTLLLTMATAATAAVSVVHATEGAAIPKKFLPTHRSYHGRYFVTDTVEQGVEFTTELLTPADLNATTMAAPHPSLVVQINKMLSTFDYVELEGQRMKCAAFRHATVANTSCFQPMTCEWTFEQAVGDAADHQRQHELILKGGPNVSTQAPTCVASGEPMFAGIIQAEAEFAERPLYSYGALVDHGTRTFGSDSAIWDEAKATAWKGDAASRAALALDRVETGFHFYGGAIHDAHVVRYHENATTAAAAKTAVHELSTRKGLTAICDVFDTSSYTMHNGMGLGHALSCPECEAVHDMYAHCNADEECAGFTTTLEDDHGVVREVPLFLHYGGRGVNASATYHGSAELMYYEKQPESARTCHFRTETAGRLQIFFLLSFFMSSTASIYVGDEFVKECGKSSAFVGDGVHVHGYDHSCHTYMLCHVMDAYAGEEIKVVSNFGMRQGGCKESLNVIVNVSEVTSYTKPPAPAPKPTASPITASMFGVQRHIWAAPTNDEYTVIKLYAIHVRDLALQVYQTGWDCSNSDGECHNTTIDVTRYTGARRRQDAIDVQSCGGEKGFYEDVGHSDQCHKKLWCSSVAPLSDFSGFIEIKYRPRDLLFRSHECNFFRAELFGVAERSAEAFLLVDHDDFLVSPLVAVPLGSNRTVASYMTTAFAHAPLALPIEVGSFGHPFGTFYVDYNHHEPTPSEIAGNVSFACVVDHIGVSTVRCKVAVPENATRIGIDVAQTNFHVNEFTWELERHGAVKHHTCGGPVHGFHGRKGRSDLCHTYLACADEYMYSSGSDTRWDHVVINIPRSVTSGACNFSFVGVVHFTEVPIPQVSAETCYHGQGFVCEADLTCIAATVVCDGINNCSDGADEAACTNWRLTELEKRFSLPGAEHTLRNITTLAECRRDAVLNGTVAFAFREYHQECILFEASAARRAMRAPSQFLVAQEDVEFLTRVDDVGDYNKCSAVLHCNHHGELRHEAELRDGDACFCHCHQQYTEHDCSVFKSLGSRREMMAVFAKAAVDVHPSPAAMARGILHSNHEVRLTPQAFEYFNATHESMGFTVDSLFEPGADVQFTEELFNATVLAEINHLLEESVQPRISFFTTRTPMSLYEPLPGCREIGSETAYACAVTTALHVRSVRVSGVSVASMQVDATFSGRSRRATNGTRHTEHYHCNDSNTVNTTIGQCTTSTCVVYIDDTVEAISVAAVRAVHTGNFVCNVQRGLTVEGQHAVDLPPRESDERLVVSDPRPLAMLVAPAVVLVLVFSLLVAGVAVLVKHSAAVAAKLADDPYAELMAAEPEGSMARDMIENAAEELVIADGGDAPKRAVTAVLVWLIVSFLCGLSILAHQMAKDRESNFEVVVEHYRDPACYNSSASFLPYRVSRLHADKTCHRLAAQGDTDRSIAASGDCVQTADGHHDVEIAFAHDVDHCSHTATRRVRSGTCVNLADLFGPSMEGTGYTLLECLPIAMGVARFNAFVAMAAVPQEAEHLTAVPPPLSMRPYTQTVGSSVAYFRPFAVLGHREVASSAHAARLETMYDNHNFYGNYDGRRLIVHTQHEWRDGERAFASTAAIEKANLEHLQDLSSTILALAPNHKDYPLGEIFNHWDEPGELSGHAAGPNSHRYYYMADTSFDVGRQYGPTAEHDVPGEGFTFQAWVRASEDTHGFAFALVDGVEHRTTGHNIALDRLMTILDSGHGEWFESQWHVYAALYMDGGEGAVHFIYADPRDELEAGYDGGCDYDCTHGGNATTSTSTSSSSSSASSTQHTTAVQPGLRKRGGAIVDVKWDLHAIGMMRVFNRMWHRISVVLREENGRTDARIFVDSQTSMLDEGWTKCVPRRPSPIADLSHVNVEGVTEQSVTEHGVMYVGYFNGGVHAVEFSDHPLTKDEATLTSSDEVRAHLALREDDHRAVAWAMFGLAGAGLLLLLLPARRMLRNRREGLEADEQEALVLYSAMTLLPLANASGVYATAPYGKVRHWLGLDGKDGLLRDVLEEIFAAASEDEPFEALLVKCLWRSQHPDDAAAAADKLPTAKAWNGFVASAAKEEDGAEHDQQEGPAISVLGTAFAVTEAATAVISRAVRLGRAKVAVNDAGRLSFDRAVSVTRRVGDDSLLHATQQHPLAPTSNDDAMSAASGSDDDDNEPTMSNTDKNSNKHAAADSDVAAFDLATADAAIPVVTGARGGGTVMPSMKDIVAAVLHVMQTMALYTTTMVLPRAYLDTFGAAYTFSVLEWSELFTASASLLTPVIQFVIGVAVCIGLVYAAATDHRTFRDGAARYGQHRDVKELSAELGPEFAARAAARGAALKEPHVPPAAPYRYEVELLAPAQRGAIEHFGGGPGDEWRAGDEARISAALTVRKGEARGEFINAATGARLATVGATCPEHPECVLVMSVQSNIVPTHHPRACCAVENGTVCGKSVGALYQCNEPCADGGYTCDFALCEGHCRPTVGETVRSGVRSKKLAAAKSGGAPLVTAAIIAVTALLYMPFVKTACMIAICHPFYQCEFEHCWRSADQKFAVAAYMATFFLVLFGVGVPALEVAVLATRVKALNKLFRGAEYEGRFMEKGDNDNSPPQQQGQPHRQGQSSGTVRASEWLRYLSSDETQLAALYESFTVKWIFVAPLLLLFKLILLTPVVFTEPESLTQLACMAGAEGLYFAFVYGTEPYLSPVTSLTVRVGSIHQLLIVGMVSLHMVEVFHGNRDGLATAMLATSSAYVAFVVVEVALLHIVPVVMEKRHAAQLRATLSRLGLHPSKSATLFVDPGGNAIRRQQHAGEGNKDTEEQEEKEELTPSARKVIQVFPSATATNASADDATPSPFDGDVSECDA